MRGGIDANARERNLGSNWEGVGGAGFPNFKKAISWGNGQHDHGREWKRS